MAFSVLCSKHKLDIILVVSSRVAEFNFNPNATFLKIAAQSYFLNYPYFFIPSQSTQPICNIAVVIILSKIAFKWSGADAMK